MTSSKEMWDDIPQIIADKTNRKAFAIDARNHGDSEFTDYFSFDINIDDLFQFMDTMGIQKAILIGHSMGGITATHAALRKPDRVEAVFSEDMFVKKLPEEFGPPLLALINLWIEITKAIPKTYSENEAVQFIRNSIYKLIPEDHLFSNERKAFQMISFKLKQKEDGSYDVGFNSDALSRMIEKHNIMSDPHGQFNGPAIFIYGGLSKFGVGKEESNIKKHFPKAVLIEFPEATHLVHTEVHDKFVDTILHYL